MYILFFLRISSKLRGSLWENLFGLRITDLQTIWNVEKNTYVKYNFVKSCSKKYI